MRTHVKYTFRELIVIVCCTKYVIVELSRARRPAKRAFHYAASDQSQTSPFLRPQTARHNALFGGQNSAPSQEGSGVCLSVSVCLSLSVCVFSHLWTYSACVCPFSGCKIGPHGQTAFAGLSMSEAAWHDGILPPEKAPPDQPLHTRCVFTT